MHHILNVNRVLDALAVKLGMMMLYLRLLDTPDHLLLQHCNCTMHT